MKFEFAGKYLWSGIYLDPETEEQLPFGVFADDWADALEGAGEVPGEIVALVRGDEVTDGQMPDVPQEIIDAIEEAQRNRLN